MTASSGLARLLVALDLPSPAQNLALVERVATRVGGFKVGPTLFLRAGPAVVRDLVAQGLSVFLDLKFHDIPNTVAESVKAACELGVALCTVHTQGGPAMLEAAARAARDSGEQTAVLGVTALTSDGLASADEVVALARRAQEAGCHGVVCSALEAAAVRRACGAAFTIVTPGLRFGQAAGDQARVATPRQAIEAGADWLVVGRPIYAAGDPLGALDAIESDLAGR